MKARWDELNDRLSRNVHTVTALIVYLRQQNIITAGDEELIERTAPAARRLIAALEAVQCKTNGWNTLLAFLTINGFEDIANNLRDEAGE